MNNYYNKEDLIIHHINIVINGILENMDVHNIYSSWKNTAKGLDIIKYKTSDFYLGVNLWLNLTKSEFLNNYDIKNLKSMVTSFPWLESYILINELINKEI